MRLDKHILNLEVTLKQCRQPNDVDLSIQVRNDTPRATRLAVEREAVKSDVRGHNVFHQRATDKREEVATATETNKTDELLGFMKDMMTLMKEERETAVIIRRYRGL